MPGMASDSGDGNTSLVQYSPNPQPITYPLHHGLKPPISRLSISWARGNTLRVTVLRPPQPSAVPEEESGGSVVEVKIGDDGDGEIDDAQWRRIAYGSVTPFALLQSRKNSASTLSKMSAFDNSMWSQHIMEYSAEIKSLLGAPKLSYKSPIDNPKEILEDIRKPTCLKAAWELMDIFYADQQSQAWIPERLIDWLADYDCLLSGTQSSVHSKLVDFQKELVALQAVEDHPKYWEAISSALAIGWLEVVVKLLRLHGSYHYDQLGSRETENGLVEAVAVLLSKMPRLRPELKADKLGECYKSKPDFMKAWEKWRAQITKLDCSSFWLQCEHEETRSGLKSVLQILLGNSSSLSNATQQWIELYVAHFLYIRPFMAGLESMYDLAQKCMQMKPVHEHKLIRLLIGILGENPEVIIAECSRSFGPWMIAHAAELLTVGNIQAEILLSEPRYKLGGMCIEELNRLIYAQILSSHALTWQIAPIYLSSCMIQGMGLLETVLCKQALQNNQVLLKTIEICRLYELDVVSRKIMKIAGVHDWKHGKKGSGVFWLQQVRDEVRLSRIAKQLFDFVGKSVSDESFKQWEGLIELLGSESGTAGGLEFLNKYRDFRRSLHLVNSGVATDAAQKAAEALILLMKNPSTPQRFWLPILYDALKLLNWPKYPLFDVSQTNLMLNKLQELSMVKLRPDFVDADLPPEALNTVRLALGTNLGRAILKE
ncbi:OLC1v1029059C1 [Oldenlandia corymbosa var. corymbosa]|uniref:Nuclear pore complex protein Nup85 n=1 Tax=Oldenlandia corymbosa var. corymbosa TaxID=529605 RepID=A0AAV1CDI9_OLDCO|nr:OLC1v1029059C1 [Oldenlandia corymbosa var. corymbosa]